MGKSTPYGSDPPILERTEVSHINSISGEIVRQTVEEKNYIVPIKAGWERTYRMRLQELYKLCKGAVQMDILNEIIDSISNKTLTVEVNATHIAKKLGCKREGVSRLISKLKKSDYLRGEKSPYKVDPFCVIPYGTKKEFIPEAQKEWKKESKLV